MLPLNKHINSLWRHVLHLEEMIASYRKQGKDTTSLRDRRDLTLRRLNEAKKPSPAITKKIEAVKT